MSLKLSSNCYFIFIAMFFVQHIKKIKWQRVNSREIYHNGIVWKLSLIEIAGQIGRTDLFQSDSYILLLFCGRQRSDATPQVTLYLSILKGHLTIKRASFPSILIICSTNKFESKLAFIEKRKHHICWYQGCICVPNLIQRDFYFFLTYIEFYFFYTKLPPPCGTQLPLYGKCITW